RSALGVRTRSKTTPNHTFAVSQHWTRSHGAEKATEPRRFVRCDGSPDLRGCGKVRRDQGNGTGAGRRWGIRVCCGCFLRNYWQYRRIRSSPFGDLRPTAYRRRFCFAFFCSLLSPRASILVRTQQLAKEARRRRRCRESGCSDCVNALIRLLHLHLEHLRRPEHVRAKYNPLAVGSETRIRLQSVIMFRKIDQLLNFQPAGFRSEQIDPLPVAAFGDAIGPAAIAREMLLVGCVVVMD